MKNGTIRDVMTKNPQTVTRDTPIEEAARLMREADFGTLIVNESDGTICGILTDRDIVIRSVAERQDLRKTKVESICSTKLVCLSPDDSIDHAVQMMVKHAVRRIPVAENNKAVGIVTLGDLAIARQPDSALGEISAAPAQA